MQRMLVHERPDWQRFAESLGFRYHTPGSTRYWTEGACYVFSRRQIEDCLRPATRELWEMCLEVVDRACRDEEILRSLAIPQASWNALRDSWLRHDPPLVTRFDFAFDGCAPPKLHECNGDTPGCLFEAAVFQWIWLEDHIASGNLPAECDQFNRLHEALVDQLRWPGQDTDDAPPVHVTASSRNIEDQVWASYLGDCALQARRQCNYVDLEQIGLDRSSRLVDLEDRPINSMIKAYRWELMLREPFGHAMLGPSAPKAIEPLWKLVLSSKGSLVWLWKMFPGHPNLLPCWFRGDAGAPLDECAIKPIFSIKGFNVTLRSSDLPDGNLSTPGPYGEEGFVVQALHRLPRFGRPEGDAYASVSSWVVGGASEGIGIRESDGPITFDGQSRFVPHCVLDE